MSSNHNHNQHFHGSVIKYLVVAKAVGKTREGVAGTKKKRNDKEKIETGFCSQPSGFRTHHRPGWRFLGEWVPLEDVGCLGVPWVEGQGATTLNE